MYTLTLLFSCATLSIYEIRKTSSLTPMPPLSENASHFEQKGWTLQRTAGCVGCHSSPFSYFSGEDKATYLQSLLAIDFEPSTYEP